MSGSSTGFGSKVRGPIAVLLVVVVALAAVQLLSRPGGVAATPAAFETLRLESAIDQARLEDKAVLVVATADWCGPCQAFKRSALSDPRIEEWIAANAIAIMLDVDQYPEAAEQLGVRSIPVTYLIHDGTVVGRLSGNRDAETLREWLVEQMVALH